MKKQLLAVGAVCKTGQAKCEQPFSHLKAKIKLLLFTFKRDLKDLSSTFCI